MSWVSLWSRVVRRARQRTAMISVSCLELFWCTELISSIEPKRLFASTTKQSGSTPAPSRLNRTPGPRRQVQTFSTLRTPAPAPSNSFASPTNHLSELQLSTTRQTLGVGTRGTRPSPGPTPLPSGKARRTSKSAQSSPGPTPLPSATRTRRRSRQSLTPAQPEFQTPAPRWEEEPSLGSITGGVDGLELGALNEVEELDEEMDNELEYMPPPAQGELTRYATWH